LGYVQFEGDLRKFKITCPTDPTVFVIINTHVDLNMTRPFKHSAIVTQALSTHLPWIAT
jgi:hypothetical protein